MSRTIERPRIGFIGLGVMGTPMSGHLVDAGYEVTVFDIDRGRSDALVADRPAVRVATSPADLGRSSDVVFTMLPDGSVVRDAVVGPDGVIEGLAPGGLLVDTSSSQPWITLETAEALAAAGIAMVDAPVSGAEWGAQRAELIFMAGGAADDVARAQPMLDVLGKGTYHLGPLGSGHIMKSINNVVTAMTFQATLEGLALGVAAGLDPAAMNEVFNVSTAGSWITANHIGQRILTRSFDDPFRLALMLKDVEIATTLADRLQIDLPMVTLCSHTYRDADRQFGEGSSLSDLARWTEQTTGVTIR